ncbi:MAG: Hsp70 family protein [Streptomyces sp.]|nr:Hsp70 family protein [Streptomyces sp.]
MNGRSVPLDTGPVTGGARETDILAVDFGTSTTRALLVGADGHDRVVKDPMSGSWRWTSAVYADDDEGLLFGAAAHARRQLDPARYLAEFKRLLGGPEPVRLGGTAATCTDLVAGLLARLRQEAAALLPSGSGPTHAVVTVPAGYAPEGPLWTAMLDACGRAGFTDTELLSEPVAAALGSRPPQGARAGATTLVYDLGGGTFDTALLRHGDTTPRVLGHASLDACGGRDLDRALVRWLRQHCADWLEPLLAPDDPAALGRTLVLADFARRVKHQLSGVTEVRDRLFPDTPVVTLTRDLLTDLATPLIDRTTDCCEGLLRRCDVTPEDITHVLVTGGGSRIPLVRSAVARALRRPLTVADDPDLAVVLGARERASTRSARRLPARRPDLDVEALSWHVPGGSARLVRWLRAPGDSYAPGAPLARVRLPDGALYDLTAVTPGRVVHRHAAPGARMASGDWLVTGRRPPRVGELPDTPGQLAEVPAPGPVLALAWSPDGRGLLAAGHGWAQRLDVPTGKQTATRPDAGPGRTLAVDATGNRLALVTAEGTLAVLDARTLTGPPSDDPRQVSGALAFRPYGGQLAVARPDATVELRTGTDTTGPVLRLPDHDRSNGGPRPRIRGLAFDPSGQRLTAVSRARDAEGRVTVWHVDDGTVLTDLRLDTPVERVACADGGHLALSGPGGSARSQFGRDALLWLTSAPAPTRPPGAAPAPPPSSVLARRRRGAAPALAFAPGGTVLAEGGRDATVRLWDTRRRHALHTYPTGAGVRALAFSPDGHVLAVGTDEALTLWALGAADPPPPSDDHR